jgi:hypothetical protein
MHIIEEKQRFPFNHETEKIHQAKTGRIYVSAPFIGKEDEYDTVFLEGSLKVDYPSPITR